MCWTIFRKMWVLEKIWTGFLTENWVFLKIWLSGFSRIQIWVFQFCTKKIPGLDVHLLKIIFKNEFVRFNVWRQIQTYQRQLASSIAFHKLILVVGDTHQRPLICKRRIGYVRKCSHTIATWKFLHPFDYSSKNC